MGKKSKGKSKPSPEVTTPSPVVTTPSTEITTPTEYSEETPASTVTWRIEDVSCWKSDEHGVEICSSEFVLNNVCENTWKLHLNRNNLGKFTVALSPFHFVESVTIDAEWSLMSFDGSLLYTKVTRYRPTTAKSTHPMNLSSCHVHLDDDSDTFIHNDTLTVRVRVWKQDVVSSEDERISLVTQYLKKCSGQQNIMWHIENFSTLQLNMEATMTVYLAGDAFRLSFFLTGELLEEACMNFGIFTEHARDQVMEVGIYVTSEKSTIWSRVVDKTHSFTSSARSQTWVLPNLITRREILKKSNDLILNDTLILSCLFTCDFGSYLYSYVEESYSGPERLRNVVNHTDGKGETKHCAGTIVSVVKNENVHTTHLPCNCQLGPQASVDPLSSKNILLCDIENLFKKQIFSDFELRSQKSSFRVHKNILSARSAAFNEVLCGDMKEACSMDVPDLDSVTLGHFLTFLYTGTLPDLVWEIALKLYDVAHQYEVPSLKVECCTILISSVNLLNVTDILKMADRFQDQKLTSYVFDFIQNNFDAVVLSDEWGKFQAKSLLAGKAMQAIYKRRKSMRTKLMRESCLNI